MDANSESILVLKAFISSSMYEDYEVDLERIDSVLAAYHEDVVVNSLNKYAAYYEDVIKTITLQAAQKAALKEAEVPVYTGR